MLFVHFFRSQKFSRSRVDRITENFSGDPHVNSSGMMSIESVSGKQRGPRVEGGIFLPIDPFLSQDSLESQ